MQECIPRPVPAMRYDSTFGTLCIDYITQKYICQVRKNKSPEFFSKRNLLNKKAEFKTRLRPQCPQADLRTSGSYVDSIWKKRNQQTFQNVACCV